MAERPDYVPENISDDAVAFMRICGVIRDDGSIDAAQVCREMSDYSSFLTECGKVYWHVTGGLVGKQNTLASEVISLSEEREREWVEECIKEATETLSERIAAFRNDIDEALENAESALNVLDGTDEQVIAILTAFHDKVQAAAKDDDANAAELARAAQPNGEKEG